MVCVWEDPGLCLISIFLPGGLRLGGQEVKGRPWRRYSCPEALGRPQRHRAGCFHSCPWQGARICSLLPYSSINRSFLGNIPAQMQAESTIQRIVRGLYSGGRAQAAIPLSVFCEEMPKAKEQREWHGLTSYEVLSVVSGIEA